jgi:hypothetical protein
MSDIFNDYAKIAIDKGLIKEAEAGSESNPRYDSISNDDLRALYGIKPNGEEDHILDQAHPESVVVSPAYDKMNGLVENLFERQDIMQWIATKPNDGKHTNERYVKANQELTMELLKAAFLLDRNDQEDLMKLADSCANRLTKKALGPLAVAGIVAAITAFVKYTEEFRTESSVPSKVDKILEEIEELATSEWWRYDDESFPAIYEELSQFRRALIIFKESAERVRDIRIKPLSSEKDVKTAVQDIYRKNSINNIKHYKKMCDLMLRLIPRHIKRLKLKKRQLGDPENTLAHWASFAFRFLDSDDIKDIWLELEALYRIIKKEKPLLDTQIELLNNIENEDKTLSALESESGKLNFELDELSKGPKQRSEKAKPVSTKKDDSISMGDLEKLRKDLEPNS